MSESPTYDPAVPKSWYDRFGEREWTRLTFNRTGELLFHVHMDILRSNITPGASVLELGAGAGFLTKELAGIAGRLVVSDVSEKQLALNRSKMAEIGLKDQIEAFHLLDITSLGEIEDDEFDVVVCVGGALNYTFDKAPLAIAEMLRAVKPGGTLILGVISLPNSLIRFLSAVLAEKREFGIDATRWLFKTGIQDEEHYPVKDGHYLKMMRSADLDTLFRDLSVEIVERRAAGVYSLAGEEALGAARHDEELWDLLLQTEIEMSKMTTCLDCGANTVYIVRKSST